MPQKRFKKPAVQQNIAKERIEILFKQAKEQFEKEPLLSKRYVQLARKIALKYKIRLPRELKRKICKHCHTFLVLGKNLRVRTQKGHLVYTCLECNEVMRFPFKHRNSTISMNGGLP